jgi:hypothetical protein
MHTCEVALGAVGAAARVWTAWAEYRWTMMAARRTQS